MLARPKKYTCHVAIVATCCCASICPRVCVSPRKLKNHMKHICFCNMVCRKPVFSLIFLTFSAQMFQKPVFSLSFLTFLTFWGRNRYRCRRPSWAWPPAAILVTAPKSQKSQKTQWKHRFLKHLSWKSQKTQWKHRFLAHHVTKTIVLYRFYTKINGRPVFYCKNKFS